MIFFIKRSLLMNSTEKPKIVKVLRERGEINDEVDYALMNYLMQNRGTGFTVCQPQLVELEGNKNAIKLNIDNTFVNNENRLMGLGIVGTLFVDYDSLSVIYCTPKVELEKNIQKLKDAGIQPQPRPRGKY
jgi:hypothetical protein